MDDIVARASPFGDGQVADETTPARSFVFPNCTMPSGPPRLLGNEAYAFYMDTFAPTVDAVGGAPLKAFGATPGDGHSFGGYDFGAVSRSIDLPDAPTSGIASGTLAFWIKPTAFSAGFGAVYVKIRPGVTRELEAGFGTDKKIYFATSQDAGSTALKGATALPLDKWTHVAFTWGAGGKKVYLNGVLSASNSDTTGVGSRSTVTCLGADCNNRGGTGLKASLDEVRVHRAALTPAEIADLMERPYR